MFLYLTNYPLTLKYSLFLIHILNYFCIKLIQSIRKVSNQMPILITFLFIFQVIDIRLLDSIFETLQELCSAFHVTSMSFFLNIQLKQEVKESIQIKKFKIYVYAISFINHLNNPLINYFMY